MTHRRRRPPALGSSSASSTNSRVVAQLGRRPAPGRRPRPPACGRAAAGRTAAPGPGGPGSPWRSPGWGGSGRWSMEANRNARGHEVNASTREGDKLVGTGYAMGPMLREGCRESWRPSACRRPPDPQDDAGEVVGDHAGDLFGVLHRAEVADVVQAGKGAPRQVVGDLAGPRGRLERSGSCRSAPGPGTGSRPGARRCRGSGCPRRCGPRSRPGTSAGRCRPARRRSRGRRRPSRPRAPAR